MAKQDMMASKRQSRRRSATLMSVSVVGLAVALQGCNSAAKLNPFEPKVVSHGYQINEQALSLVPVGSSREQVLLSLGTPSTTNAMAGGTETYYYISQKKARSAAFLNAKVVDQRVLAVYFGEDDNVSQIGNYGLKDGKVFDFTRRVTPTGGKDLSFLSQLLGAAGTVTNPLGGG